MSEEHAQTRTGAERPARSIMGALIDSANEARRRAERDALERRHRAFEEHQRDAWFAEHGTSGPFPDLTFDTPECPICMRSTTYEDGSFRCETCEVVWPRSGYGAEAEWRGETSS